MSLVIQLLACLGAVVVVAMLVHGEVKRSTVAASTAAVATVVVALLGAQGLWATANTHIQNGKQQRQIPHVQLPLGGASAVGVNGGFVEFAVGRLRPKDTFFILPANPTVQQWLGYRALPQLAATRRDRANVLVFYNTTPRKEGYRKGQLTDVRTYQPNYIVARLAHPRSR